MARRAVREGSKGLVRDHHQLRPRDKGPKAIPRVAKVMVIKTKAEVVGEAKVMSSVAIHQRSHATALWMMRLVTKAEMVVAMVMTTGSG